MKKAILTHLVNDEVFILKAGTAISEGLEMLEAGYLECIYKKAKYNQSRAARMAGISRGSFRMKMKEYFGDRYL